MASDSGDVSVLHQALVDKLKREGCIRTARVEAAFRAVPRHLFLPGVPWDQVYRDQSIPTRHLEGQIISSSSQPAMMAIMLEQLELERGHRVLEIGAGTGYNAALMAYLVGDAGQVVTVDIDLDIVEEARKSLMAAGLGRVQVVCGDGGFGCPDSAPYDRIVLTVGAGDITPAWREQLKPDGRLLLPLSIAGDVQKSVAFEQADGYLTSVSVRDCSFMLLRGAFAGPESCAQLGAQAGLQVTVGDRALTDVEAIYRLLIGPHQDWATAVRAGPDEIFGGLNLWLALHEPGFCWLYAEGELAEQGLVPDLFRFSSQSQFCSTVGLLDEANVCVLIGPSDQSPPFELHVRSYGPGKELAHRLIERVAAWDAAGRPSTDNLRIRVYPRETDLAPDATGFVISKQWTQLVLDWR